MNIPKELSDYLIFGKRGEGQEMSDYKRLTIPTNTRLLSVERLLHGEWAIWILTNEYGLKRPHWERDGTFLILNVDGSIDRTTISGGVVVDLIEVLPPRDDNNAREEED